MSTKRIALGAVTLAAALGLTAPGAGAQAPSPSPARLPSVDIFPVGTNPKTDPNSGQWFVTSLIPGETKRLAARFVNPAPVPQTVKLYLADLRFGPDGTPQVLKSNFKEVGTWGGFGQSTVEIPPNAVDKLIEFTVTAPKNAEAGDHVGAVVAEHQPEEGRQIRTIKRIAVRLYITIPGEARRDFAISDERVTLKQNSVFWPSSMGVRVILENKGRVRLHPTVRVNGVKASGPELLMSQSIEPYFATAKIPFWGGPVSYQIEATSVTDDQRPGPVRQIKVSAFVIPWHLITMLVLAAGFVLLVRSLFNRKGEKYQAVVGDLKRIERLMAEQRFAASVQGEPGEDPTIAIRAALKQARRAGDAETEQRLKEKLAESKSLRDEAKANVAGSSVVERLTGSVPEPEDDEPPFEVTSRAPQKQKANGALGAILAELGDAPPKRRDALIRAARAYGADGLSDHLDLIESLPQEVRSQLFGSPRPRKPAAPRATSRRP